jgi:hypothetical protein
MDEDGALELTRFGGSHQHLHHLVDPIQLIEKRDELVVVVVVDGVVVNVVLIL